MKLELLIIIITIFFIMNTYYDGYYLTLIMSWKKYYMISFYLFSGLCLYLFLKRNPHDSKKVFYHANEYIKYLPIDKNAKDILTPVFDFTKSMSDNTSSSSSSATSSTYPQFNRMLQSGQTQKFSSSSTSSSTKRSVSETKKKYIAAQQQWKCGHCSIQLPAWFEVDHINKLEHGGSNHITNLIALCRECHGKKTTLENLTK